MRGVALALLVLSGPVQASDETMPSAADQRASVEYYLAAAAQPGDAVSDSVLANLFANYLDPSRSGHNLPKDPDLLERVVEEHDRLKASADAALMDNAVLLTLNLRCHGALRDEALCAARRARLAEIDGDNAATAVALMAAAWASGDNAGFVAAAARGAEGTRHDSAIVQVFDSMRRRFDAVPDAAAPDVPLRMDGIPRADAGAMAFSAAVAMPGYQHFGQPCRESEGELLQDCLTIARSMLRDGESIIEAYIGSDLLSRRGTEADRKEVDSRRRELAWLQDKAMAELQVPTKLEARVLQDYFDTYAREGEEAAMRSVLRARGIPLTPPADWVAPGRWASP